MQQPSSIARQIIALSLSASALSACKANDNPTSNREDRQYHFDGEATGLFAEMTDATCIVRWDGTPTLTTPHIEVQLSFGDETLGEPKRFSPFLDVVLEPLPPPDNTRVGAVVAAHTRTAEYTERFDLSLVAAEYEFGLPVMDYQSLWITRMTVPEQTFSHPTLGEITVEGRLENLYIACL